MPAQIPCPSCGGMLAVDGSLLGSEVSCPLCNHVFLAPKPGAQPQPPQPQPLQPQPPQLQEPQPQPPQPQPPPQQPQPPAPKPTSKASVLDDNISIDMSLHPTQAPSDKGEKAKPAQGKTCPSCNSPMEVSAIVCPKCNLNVMTGKKIERAEPAAGPAEPEAAGVSVKTVALIVVGAIVLIIGFWFHFGRGPKEEASTKEAVKATVAKKPQKTAEKEEAKEAPEGKAEAQKEERALLFQQRKNRNIAEDRVGQAEYRENGRKWDEARTLYAEAVKFYADSDQPEKAENIKKRLAALEKVIEGTELEKAEKRDEAIAAYKEAKENIGNKAFIESQVEYLEGIKGYKASYKQGEADLEAGKWEEAKSCFEKAFEIADKLHLKDQKTDARYRASNVDKIRQGAEGLRDDMRWILGDIEKEKNLCALYAAAHYYAHSEAHRLYADEAKAKLEETQKALTPGSTIPTEAARVTEPQKRFILTLKDGKTLDGKILEEEKGTIKLEVTEEGKTKTMPLLAALVEKREEREISADEANTQKARAIFGEAVQECDSKSWRKALAKIGLLLHQFGDLPFMKDAAAQRELAKKVAPNLEGETTLEALLQFAVEHCEAVCPTCRGIGKIRCSHCNQDGKILVVCTRCMRKVWCPHCGEDMTILYGRLGEETACPKCGKTFVPLNVKCPVCGKVFRRKLTPTPENVVCPYCKEKGQAKEFLPEEKIPESTAMIPCPSCRGAGKIGKKVCNRCKGRKMEPCPQCDKDKPGMTWIRCPYCRPPDFVIKCPDCAGRGVRAGKGTKALR